MSEQGSAFTYGPAQNLLARTEVEQGIADIVPTPPDASVRNRPASVGGVPLAYDANGNLTARADQRLYYDERNRLTRVTTAGGTEIVRYEYDVFDRRIGKMLPGTTEHTVYAGWQALEAYQDGQLHQRRTWGLGIDEAVVGEEMHLTLPAEALADSFLNQPGSAHGVIFDWPVADAVIEDTTAPEFQDVMVRNGKLQIQLTEVPDLAAATRTLQLDSAATHWELSADGYTLSTTDVLPAGSHTLTASTGALDLAGNGLAESFSVIIDPLTVSGTGFEAPDPRQIAVTSTRNPLGFQGLPIDAETGLLYARNRYFDPEIGRFITTDPLGDVDGPNTLAYAGNDPINFSDPLGLQKELSVMRELELIEQRAELARSQRELEKQTSWWSVTKQVLKQSFVDPVQRRWFEWEREKEEIVEGAGDAAELGVRRLLPHAPVAPRRQQEAALVGLEGQAVSGGNPGAIFRNDLRATSGEIASTGAEGLTETGLTIAEAEAAGAVLGLGLRFAGNAVNARRLAQQLTREEAAAVFARGGTLHPEVIAESRLLIRGNDFGNPAVIRDLTADRSSIADWAKFSTGTFRSPSGHFQVQFYRNTRTGAVNYGLDYKAVFNRGVQP